MLYKLTMLTIPCLKIFTVFSSFPLIIGDDSRNRITSVGIDHDVADGEQFIKRIVHGEKISENPGLLMFTAPYKLCEGGCKGSDGGNIGMGFPLFVGKKGIKSYKSIYSKDFEKIHTNNPNAPFKRSTTKPPTTTPTTTVATTTVSTTCKIVTIIIMPTTEPPPTTTTTVCPFLPFGVCMKYKKNKTKNTLTVFTTADVATTEVTMPDIASAKNEEMEDNSELMSVAVTINDESYVANASDATVIHQMSEDINNNHYNEFNITTATSENKELKTNNDINDIVIIEDVTETGNNETNINENLQANNANDRNQQNGTSIYRTIVKIDPDYLHVKASTTTETPLTKSDILTDNLFASKYGDLDVAVLREQNRHHQQLNDYSKTDNDVIYFLDY